MRVENQYLPAGKNLVVLLKNIEVNPARHWNAEFIFSIPFNLSVPFTDRFDQFPGKSVERTSRADGAAAYFHRASDRVLGNKGVRPDLRETGGSRRLSGSVGGSHGWCNRWSHGWRVGRAIRWSVGAGIGLRDSGGVGRGSRDRSRGVGDDGLDFIALDHDIGKPRRSVG